jgi:endoribonuclease Nob1
MLILDSSALFAMQDLPDEEAICPPGVIDELRRYKDPRLDLWGDMLRVSDCTEASIRKVEDAARKSGDLGRLSPVDITVLALALDADGTVLSDDYSIENVAGIMGIPCRAVGTDGIKKIAKWNYRCQGCGKWYKEKLPDCPICGAQMRSYRRK